MDSRAELYGDAFLGRYERIITPDPEAVKAAIDDYHITWTIFGTHSPDVSVMDRLTGWHRVYTDEFAVVHIRDR